MVPGVGLPVYGKQCNDPLPCNESHSKKIPGAEIRELTDLPPLFSP
jgi:hypothetical protein